MKTILNLKQYVILLVTAFAMASCLGSNDPDFTVGGIGYVIQTVREMPGEAEATTISSRFTPVIYAVANEPMTRCSVKAPGGESILMTQMESFGGHYWLSNLSYNSSMDKLPSGTFTITAYNQDEEPAQGTAVINNTTEMKTKLKGNVECNDAVITAIFNKVEGATDYFVVLKKSSSSTLYDNSVIVASYKDAALDNSERKITLPESEYSSKITSLEAGSYYLTIAAAIVSSSSVVLYQESDVHTIFTKK